MTRVAAFDVGSTNLRCALGDPDAGFETSVRTERTDAARLPGQIADRVADLAGGDPVDAVSVATTGVVDRSGAVAFDALDRDDTVTVDLARDVSEAVGVPVRVENDAGAAALGEYHFGDGADCRCLVHLTVGSGVGAGVCVDGDLFRGESGGAGEVGVFPVRAEDETDSYGVRGALEAYCSGRGIPGFVERLLAAEDRETRLRDRDSLSAGDLFEAAEAGDGVARDYRERVGRLLAAGVGAVVSAYDPGLIVASGSVATNNPEWFHASLDRHLSAYVLDGAPQVRLSDLGDRAGLYGALAAGADAVDGGEAS